MVSACLVKRWPRVSRPAARTCMRAKTRELRLLFSDSVVAIRRYPAPSAHPRQSPPGCAHRAPLALAAAAVRCVELFPCWPRGHTNGSRSGMNPIEYIESRRDANLADLVEFLRIPSISTKSEHKPDVERAARWVMEKLRGQFEKVELIPTKGHPLVFAESAHLPGKP